VRRACRFCLPAALLAIGACDWASLARQALTYRTLGPGDAGNVASADSLLYVTLADAGLAIHHARTGLAVATLPPPAGTASVDDVAIADGLLFTLDARPPGHLAVYALGPSGLPELVAPPRAVPVGPFSGVTARAGVVIVSGGTSRMTAWRYDRHGRLGEVPATADLGRGQPDAVLSDDGTVAYVATHFRGPRFGLSLVGVDSAPLRLHPLGHVALDGAGFTAGGAKPANFPIAAASLGRDTVLVAHGGGVAILNVRETRHPVVLETVALGGPAVSVAVRGAVAVVAVGGASPALAVLRVAAGRAAVTRRIPLPPGTFPTALALTATHAAVTLRDRGVQTYEP
jgi:hypothetical protein